MNTGPVPVHAAGRETADAAARRSGAWCWGGLAFVVAALVLLELLDPFFFCQDDALSLELPVVLQACRGLWRGMMPSYNPYTFLGDPTHAVNGFYPPLFGAYAIARHVLGEEGATFDVFAVVHLLVGYGLTFLAARRLGVAAPLACLAGAAFVLSGPVLVMARCWHSFAVPAVFIPLFALLVDRLRDGPVDWRWPAGADLSLGLFYHAGFPQLFVLGCGLMLVHAAALAACGLVPWRRLAWLLPALAFGAAISVPVFFQQWRLSQEIVGDDPGSGEGVAAHLLPMLLPYPLVHGTLPNGWGNVNPQWGGHFYYSGTVLLAASLAAIAACARRLVGPPSAGSTPEEPRPVARLQLPLAIPGVTAFLLALGPSGGLWWLMGMLPVGLRNNPFRALPWVIFFAGLAGACFLEDALAAARFSAAAASPWWRRRRVEAGLVGVGLTLVALHVTRVAIAFFVYGFMPYPQLPPDLLTTIGPDAAGRQQRSMSFAALRSSDPSYPLALPHNLPCVYEMPAVFGYNPLVQRFGRFNSCLQRIIDRPAEALAAYGVRWLLVHRTDWGGWPPQTENRFERFFPFVNLLRTLGTNPAVPLPDIEEYLRVIELPNAAPLAFDTARPTEPLPLRMSVTGLDIDLVPQAEPRRVVANFLRYPDIAATADGRPAETAEDDWQRIVVAVPAHAARVQIRYRPPWKTALIVALLSAFAGVMGVGACRRLAA